MNVPYIADAIEELSGMKKTLLFLLLTLPFTGFAQQKTTFSGILADAEGETMTLIADLDGDGLPQDSMTAIVKKEKFTFPFKLIRPTLATLEYDGEQLECWLEPGNKLEVKRIAKNGPVKFYGEGAENNNFLYSFRKKFRQQYNPGEIRNKALTLGVDAYELELYESVQKEKEYLKKETEGLSETFKTFIGQNTRYNYLDFLFAYPIIRAEARKSARVTALPDVMLEVLTDDMVQVPEAMQVEAYRRFLIHYTTYYASKANDFKTFTNFDESLKVKFDFIGSELEGRIQSFTLAAFLLKQYEKSSAGNVERLLGVLKKSDQDGKYSAWAEAEIKDWLAGEKLAANENGKGKSKSKTKSSGKGKDYPFTLWNADGKKVSLNDYMGKVVYVDFWASWCRPCAQQFPYAKELKGMLDKKEKKEIVFLYISIDNTKDAWQGGIQKFGIEGEHLHAIGGWSSEICAYFKVNSIPRYMIIDKKGRIADANAKRPASGEELLMELRRLL